MAPDRQTASSESVRSGTTTPPRKEMGTSVSEVKQFVVGNEYWAEDEKGSDVWSVVEVLEQHDGLVSVKALESGNHKEMDLVSCYYMYYFLVSLDY